MSGGSFNYLYCLAYDLRGIVERRETLTEMLEALRHEYPDSKATRDTEQLVAALDALDEAVRLGAERLAPVWRAVEWEHSGDTAEEDTLAAIEAYERREGER